MKTILLLSLAAISACSYASPQAGKSRLTGGSNAARNQFPYQVSVQWREDGVFKHTCGGTILSPTYVLTAGHCINLSPSLADVRVVAGILNLKEDGVVVNVSLAFRYPMGDEPNDLALIGLASALSFSESIQPIGLPVPGAVPEGRALLSGWGSISNTSTLDFPDILQYVNVTILSNDECNDALIAYLGQSGLLFPSNVCTGPLYGGISACGGDSGGPLVQQDTEEVIGVVSWGISPCGSPGVPTVYTKVSSFVDYIRENVPDLPDLSNTNLK